MATKREILAEVAAVVDGIAGLTGNTFVYPYEYASIPKTAVPAAIVGQFYGTGNSTPATASGCGNHNWTVEVLVIVDRDKESSYPSARNASQELFLEDWEVLVSTALLGATLTDAIQLADITSSIGWFQWEGDRRSHEPVFGTRVLLPVSQQVTF